METPETLAVFKKERKTSGEKLSFDWNSIDEENILKTLNNLME